MGIATTLGVLVAVVGLASGCDRGPGVRSDGPLEVVDSAGGNALDPPQRWDGKKPWKVNFGTLLCVRDGARATITDVTFDERVKPAGRSVWLHTGDMDVDGSSSIYSVSGDESRLGGTLVPAVGARLDLPCDAEPGQYVELVVQIRSDAAGGWLADPVITYEVRGREYRTPALDFDYVACGTAVHSQQWCPSS